ncbi:hypothetical protein ASPZODRAFT_61828, partial [Penicilliopsis zonata CBS 506.65]
LESLPYVPEAIFNNIERKQDLCLEGTREALLQEIYEWADSDQEQPLLWLSGWAGTGKSTIGVTVARKYEEKGRLGASFLFSKGKGNSESAMKFVATVAYQLAQKSSLIKDSICKTLEKDRDIVNKSLSDQWHQLILKPMSDLPDDEGKAPYILVIDALDECEESRIRDIQTILFENQSNHLRVLVTSRPNLDPSFQPASGPGCQSHSIVLHNIATDIVERDILKFLEHHLAKLRPDWPGTERINRLVQMASGLFIWAATASRYVTSGGGALAERRLRKVLDNDICPNSPEGSLDDIYITVLRDSIPANWSDEERRVCCYSLRQYLGSIVVLFEQMSPHSLYKIMEVNPDKKAEIEVHELLRNIRAILDVPEGKDEKRTVFRLHHPSLRGFLLDANRCTDMEFHVDKKQAHRTLLDGCLQLLSQTLKRDICGLEASGIFDRTPDQLRIEHLLPPEVQYACLYWVKHLQQSGYVVQENDTIYQFINEHLLHWLEALNWMGKGHDALEALRCLDSLTIQNKRSGVSILIKSLIRFTQRNLDILTEAPLQLYSRTLPFAPRRSPVCKKDKRDALHSVRSLPKFYGGWARFIRRKKRN